MGRDRTNLLQTCVFIKQSVLICVQLHLKRNKFREDHWNIALIKDSATKIIPIGRHVSEEPLTWMCLSLFNELSHQPHNNPRSEVIALALSVRKLKLNTIQRLVQCHTQWQNWAQMWVSSQVPFPPFHTSYGKRTYRVFIFWWKWKSG